MTTDPLRAAFVSHGGGPLPLLGDPAHDALAHGLREMAAAMPRPSAIVVVSAHWETTVPTITAGAHPSLIYDYGGFPPESYALTYPAPGAPALASRAFQLLHAAGLNPQLDDTRGFDHGMFVPLTLMHAQADIPCIQVSLCHHLDPAQHLRMGKALSSLGQVDQPGRENAPVLLLGSGFSFHNMRAFFSPVTPQNRQLNVAFEQWLHSTCTDTGLSEADRERRLLQWAQAPGARYCHPREEHLLPLHVCQGAAARACSQSWQFEIMGQQASAYLW